MKILTSDEKHSELEKDSPSSEKAASFICQIQSRLQKICRPLLWNCNPSERIQVWHYCDRHGNIEWNANDLRTEQAIRYVSEEQMRAWIEHRK